MFILVLIINLLLSTELFAQEQTSKPKPKVFGNSDLGAPDKGSQTRYIDEYREKMEEHLKTLDEDKKAKYRLLNETRTVKGQKQATLGEFTFNNRSIAVEVDYFVSRTTFLAASSTGGQRAVFVLEKQNLVQMLALLDKAINYETGSEELNTIADSTRSTSLSIVAVRGGRLISLEFKDSALREMTIELDKEAAKVLKEFLIKVEPFEDKSKTKTKK